MKNQEISEIFWVCFNAVELFSTCCRDLFTEASLFINPVIEKGY